MCRAHPKTLKNDATSTSQNEILGRDVSPSTLYTATFSYV